MATATTANAPIHTKRLRDTAASPYTHCSIAKARGDVMLRGLIVAVVVAFGGAAAAQELYPLPTVPAGVAWPTQEWAEAPLPEDVDRAALDLAVTEAFAGRHPLMGETRAVLVVQSGRIVFERYADGFTRDTRLNSWSMGKSVTHALVGA